MDFSPNLSTPRIGIVRHFLPDLSTFGRSGLDPCRSTDISSKDLGRSSLVLTGAYPCERCHGGRGLASCIPPATRARKTVRTCTLAASTRRTRSNQGRPSQPSQDKQAPCELRVRERVPRRGETRASRVRSAFQKFAKFSESYRLILCRLLTPVATLPVAAGTWSVCV